LGCSGSYRRVVVSSRRRVKKRFGVAKQIKTPIVSLLSISKSNY